MHEDNVPGVYIEEISRFPPGVAEVNTAIPAFIGYTEKAQRNEKDDLHLIPTRISSLIEFRYYFGEAFAETSFEINIDKLEAITVNLTNPSKYTLFYSLQLYFANGGGPCYVVSIGKYSNNIIVQSQIESGIDKISMVDEVTLLVIPDAINLSKASEYYQVQIKAIEQCADLLDRFALVDVYRSNPDWRSDIAQLRLQLKEHKSILKYAAAYFPALFVNFDFNYKDAETRQDNESAVKVISNDVLRYGKDLGELKGLNNVIYQKVKQAISEYPILLPATPAIAGIYATIDGSRGVWKAPANTNINAAIKTAILINEIDQETLNVDPDSGLSVNTIRAFSGKGPAIVWGARTLDGNNNEWRYISVRRYFNMIEESIKKSTAWAVFEPNTPATWVRVKGMIENYLILQWRQGALQGSKPEQGFYVKIGLGSTMTQQDILEGRMIVEIGMAPVRPAEFIILRFSHKMIEE